jgi:hypothetical protein
MYSNVITGADPGFQVRGVALKKIAPSGGRHEKSKEFKKRKGNYTIMNQNHICNTNLMIFYRVSAFDGYFISLFIFLL